MIYINYDGPTSPMLHTKFRGNRPTGSGEKIFKRLLFIAMAAILVMSYLSAVKTIIDVPGKVVHLHYTTVYCAYLSVVSVAFRSCLNLA